MNQKERLFSRYENMRLVRYEDIAASPSQLVAWDDLPERAVTGVLKADFHVNGKLMQLYSKQENHVGIIAATRMGKTTSYIVPQILSFARQKVKRPMIITDPKGEIYRATAATLREQSYQVYLINFRDFMRSEYWNPFLPIYEKYLEWNNLEKEIEPFKDGDKYLCRFRGEVYDDQRRLDDVLETLKRLLLGAVGAMIDDLATMFLPIPDDRREPMWDYGARDIFKGIVWGLLEDIDRPENPTTPDNFSLNSVLTVIEHLAGEFSGDPQETFFSRRDRYDSRAYTTVANVLFIRAEKTRDSYISTLRSGISEYFEIATRVITTCKSFDIRKLVHDERPSAIFIDFRDELKSHYLTISRFVQDTYRILIEEASGYPRGKLPVPWYFILDEFGNFPKIQDFETVISACAGRNIWFMLVLQSYAQLDNIYKENVSKIIRDNLNVSVFFGSNNLNTIKEFSEECGQYTTFAPSGALNGQSVEMQYGDKDTIALVPKSMLSALQPGECIVREIADNCVYFSKMERYFECEEMNSLPQSDEKAYKSATNPMDSKYWYDFYKGRRED